MEEWVPEIGVGHADAYVLLADAIEHAVRIGRLQPGDRLPTHRKLARQLGVAVSTVTRGYGEATVRGILESTVGRGTFVRAPTPGATAESDERGLQRVFVSLVSRATAIDLSLNHPFRGGAGRVLEAGLKSLVGADLEFPRPVLSNPGPCRTSCRWLRMARVPRGRGRARGRRRCCGWADRASFDFSRLCSPRRCSPRRVAYLAGHARDSADLGNARGAGRHRQRGDCSKRF